MLAERSVPRAPRRRHTDRANTYRGRGSVWEDSPPHKGNEGTRLYFLSSRSLTYPLPHLGRKRIIWFPTQKVKILYSFFFRTQCMTVFFFFQLLWCTDIFFEKKYKILSMVNERRYKFMYTLVCCLYFICTLAFMIQIIRISTQI